MRAEMVAIAPKGPVRKVLKGAAVCLDEEGGAVEVKGGGNTQEETKREEEGRSDAGRSRPPPGSTQLRFVFRSALTVTASVRVLQYSAAAHVVTRVAAVRFS